MMTVELFDVGFGVLDRAGNDFQRHDRVFLSAHVQYRQSKPAIRGEATNRHALRIDRFLVSSRPLLRIKIANCSLVILRNCGSRQYHGALAFT
jgi:hypothetical protein